MPIRRVFMDWHKPALAAAAEWLCARHETASAVDLQNTIVALPGGRAGRRLLELLVTRADELGKPLVPPQIVTAGKLPEKLYAMKRPVAGGLAQQLAWIQALRSLEPEALVDLIPRLPADDDLDAWLALGRMLARLHRELASARLDFSEVEKVGRKLPDFNESGRWHVLAEVQRRYHGVLDDLGLWDVQTARLVAIDKREPKTECDIYVVGTVDLDQAQRAMLDAVADHVVAIIFAPESEDQAFDQHGCLRPEAWSGRSIALADEQVAIAGQPGEQADEVLHALAAYDGRYAAEEITVGVVDPGLIPYVEQRLAECELPTRYGVGTPVERSGPCRLLAAVVAYLERRSFEQLAALARHPDLEPLLEAQLADCDWLSLLDEYASRHLPSELNGKWLGGNRLRDPLRKLEQTIGGLVKPLAGKPRALVEWSQAIRDLLATVYGTRPYDRQNAADAAVLAACSAISEQLDEQQQIDARLSGNKIAGSQAIKMLLGQLAGENVPPPPNPSAIELLGWLELPLDDAPALVVAGFNEGFVPSAHTSDLFLPDQFRRVLGLEDNERRYARDAYALSMLAASRQQLKLIAGRRTADGDPLLPSRLLLACTGSELARRTKAFFGLEPRSPRLAPLPRQLKPAARQAFDIPHPRKLAEPINKLRVTQFRDYLACRYRFYLRHCLRLEALSDQVVELGADQFGSLVHEVLRDFGRSELADATDDQKIRDWLDGALDKAIDWSFGSRPLAAIAVQAEQLRLRLHGFARWQAAWRGDGWKIAHVERAFGDKREDKADVGPVPFEVDGEPMLLCGRIDRIDIHESTGRWMVFDYKTADSHKTPDQAHRSAGKWVDLQLPLYRHLAAALSAPPEMQVGYIVLPKDVSKAGVCAAEWTAEELAEADDAARQVIRAIRREDFWPPTTPPPAFCEDFAAICHDGQFGAIELEPEESWS